MLPKPNLRCFSTVGALFKETPNNLKGRKKSSQEWITRQLKDPYVEKSKLENYRYLLSSIFFDELKMWTFSLVLFYVGVGVPLSW